MNGIIDLRKNPLKQQLAKLEERYRKLTSRHVYKLGTQIRNIKQQLNENN